MTGFNRRYAPKYQELKALTDINMIVMQKTAQDSQVRHVPLFMMILSMSLIPSAIYLMQKLINYMWYLFGKTNYCLV